MDSKLEAVKTDLGAFVDAGRHRWRSVSPDMPALRDLETVQRLIRFGFSGDDAIEEAIKDQIEQMPSDAWVRGTLTHFGFSEDAAEKSRTQREHLAAQMHGYSDGTWYRRSKAQLGNREPREYAIDLVAELLLNRRKDVAALSSDENVAALSSWWVDQQPDPSSFYECSSDQGGTENVELGDWAWECRWIKMYVTFDAEDPRRQRYYWASHVRALADDLLVYPRSFSWTGDGDLEDVSCLVPEHKWLGIVDVPLVGDPPQWQTHLFYLGKSTSKGDELTVANSEIWFDRDYFSNPFIRARVRQAHLEYIEIAVRFPPTLEVYDLAEMRWSNGSSGRPRVARKVEPVADMWHGFRIRNPAINEVIGWRWQSRLYDGESQNSDACTEIDPDVD
ncbi:MAG TPA: hypothetical protein VIH71_06995 [Solirubrobacteraceae bacterium]